jgi:hypothetical protein
MKATVVALALAICVCARTAYADPVEVGMFGGGGTVSGVTAVGNTLSFDLSMGLTDPVYLLVEGLDARRNYQVTVNLPGGASWTGLTAEILNPAIGAGNERDPSPQPTYVPTGFSTSTDYDGFSFAQGSLLERSFLAGGGARFGVLADERTDLRDMLTFSGLGAGTATLTFGLRDFGGERSFLIRLVGFGDAVTSPEPATMLLLGTGLLAVARAARKRRPKA